MNRIKSVFALPIMACFISGLILFTVIHSGSAQDAADKEIPNIIIVTLAGVGNLETLQDPTHQYIPNLGNKIFKKGTLYTHLVDYNFQSHMPSVCSIMTGLTYHYIKYSLYAPSIFQYIRKKYQLPITKLWMIGNWYKGISYYKANGYQEDTYPATFSLPELPVADIPKEVRDISTKQELAFFDAYMELSAKMPAFPQWDAIGKMQFRVFKKIMQAYKPKFVHYAMTNTDAAHHSTYGGYLLALKNSDEQIGEIFDFIEKDPFYQNNTYLIISPDHERGLYFMGHYDNPPDNPSVVWLYIYGPRVKKGRSISRAVYRSDIFATVAYLTGVATHPCEGRVLKDCFFGLHNKQ